MTDIMREWNEALTAPKCEHGHLAPVCDLCKKDAEIARLTAERDAAFAMSRCECATDEACAELAKLRDQLHLAEVVRASQVEGLTQGAAGWRERANQLEAELAKHQESEFHPDWSMLAATRASLKEHQQMIRELRAEVAGLREDALRYHEWKRSFREGECALWNALCECQSDAEHDAAIDAERKGTT